MATTRREFLAHRMEARRRVARRRRRLDDLRVAAAARRRHRAAPTVNLGNAVELPARARRPTSPRAGCSSPTPAATVYALSQKCPHLGCRVPFCDSSGRFECPCHGSKYDLGGEWIEGPAPRGMDRYALSARQRDGTLVADTSKVITGPPREPTSSSRPPRARPACRRAEPMPRERPDPAAVRARRARAQPRPLPHLPGWSSWSCSSPASSSTGCASRRCATTPQPRSRPPTAPSARQLFATNCSSCHGKGGDRRQRAGAQLAGVPEEHHRRPDQRTSIAGGVPGTEMPAWSLAFAGTLTDEQIRQLTTYLRSLEPNAPSVPTWRQGSQITTSAPTTASH